MKALLPFVGAVLLASFGNVPASAQYPFSDATDPAWPPSESVKLAPDLKVRRPPLVSPGGKQMAIFWDGGRVGLWDAKSGDHRLWMYHGWFLVPEPRYVGFRFSHDGSRLVTWGSNAVMAVWNCETGARERYIYEFWRNVPSLPTPTPRTDEEIAEAVSWRRMPMSTVVFTDSGRSLLAAYGDGTLRKWDVQTGRFLEELRPGRARKLRLPLSAELRSRPLVQAASKPDESGAGLVTPSELELWELGVGDMQSVANVALTISQARNSVFIDESSGTCARTVFYDLANKREHHVFCGTRLIAESADGKVWYLFDFSTRKVNRCEFGVGPVPHVVDERLPKIRYPHAHYHNGTLLLLSDENELIRWDIDRATALGRTDVAPLVRQFGVPSYVEAISPRSEVWMGFADGARAIFEERSLKLLHLPTRK